MKVRTQDGRELEGTARQIITAMKSLSFTEHDLKGYIVFLQESTGAGMSQRDSIDGKCEELVDHMLRSGFLFQTNEKGVAVCSECGHPLPCDQHMPRIK